MVSVPRPVGLGRDTPARRAARERLVQQLWRRDGRRRLPGERALRDALNACDARDPWWVCEASSAGPLYFLPTRAWIAELARFVDDNGVRTVLEVCAGDGFLSRCLKRARPGLSVVATDQGAWADVAARMNDDDRKERPGVPFAGIAMGDDVVRLSAATAVRRYQPDLVLVSWAPPGTVVEQVIRGPSRLVLDISVEGDVCGAGEATWRFEKDFLSGPLEDKAFCRLDARPDERRHTTVTLYYGRNHPQFHEDRSRRRR